MGNDIITMKVIKRINDTISPHLTYLLTRIILTQTYPDILKTTCISPSLKCDKPLENIDSYRLICNLSCMDKIF